jgi:hypothetical protein
MKRHLCVTALFALVVVPDWAAACWPRWGMPSYERASSAPVRRAPVYCQPVYVQPCTPVMQPTLPPRVETPMSRPGSFLTEPARPIARPLPPPSIKPPEVEPVRPAAGIEGSQPLSATPEPAPAPVPDKKRGGLFEIPPTAAPGNAIPPPNVPAGPSADPKLPNVELPKINEPKLPPIELPNKGPDPKLPALDLPKATDPKLPALDPPKGTEPGGEPKLPPLEVPGAAPAAPAAPATPAPAVPGPAPAPAALTPKNQDLLPPLTLPPDASVAPDGPAKPVEVKSSPLGAARALTVSAFPAAGTVAANGLRKVGFYNYTKRDLTLTIEGKTVTLPAMSYLHAQLLPTFTWKCADQPPAKVTVPADATGLDVLIRE